MFKKYFPKQTCGTKSIHNKINNNQDLSNNKGKVKSEDMFYAKPYIE